MKKFVNPEIVINEFDVEDVITASYPDIELGENDFPLA